jgi:hypothetical protein
MLSLSAEPNNWMTVRDEQKIMKKKELLREFKAVVRSG